MKRAQPEVASAPSKSEKSPKKERGADSGSSRRRVGVSCGNQEKRKRPSGGVKIGVRKLA
ncbi:MAG: hypothetical protein IKK39_11925 [Thermoguttaceae bacterium]|nr:hypothetical protein [Thermoguttaceae bacterium]MBR4104755.1 hypothetical protein [Thermoguttaceae bacterium]